MPCELFRFLVWKARLCLAGLGFSVARSRQGGSEILTRFMIWRDELCEAALSVGLHGLKCTRATALEKLIGSFQLVFFTLLASYSLWY
jgi:hypothetical protein